MPCFSAISRRKFPAPGRHESKKSIEFYRTAAAYTFLGWRYSFQDRYDDAIEECLRGIALDPDFDNPHKRLQMMFS